MYSTRLDDHINQLLNFKNLKENLEILVLNFQEAALVLKYKYKHNNCYGSTAYVTECNVSSGSLKFQF